jgi:hypothetical protein
MPSEEWSIIAKLPTLAEAEVIKLLLESENVERKFKQWTRSTLKQVSICSLHLILSIVQYGF